MSDYLRRGWDFIKRHKKKLMAMGVISAIGIGGYYYAKKMVQDGMRQVEEMGREIQEQMMEQQQRQDELNRIRLECANMVLTFIPPVRNVVKQYTDPRPVTEKLKHFREQRKAGSSSALKGEVESDDAKMEALWDELKVVGLSRLFASIYALCVVNALLRVQLHLMARIAFVQVLEARKQKVALEREGKISEAEMFGSGNSAKQITREVRERFLFAGSDHLINRGDGMRILVDRVRNGIATATEAWLMGTDDVVTREEILSMIKAIRRNIERGNEFAVYENSDADNENLDDDEDDVLEMIDTEAKRLEKEMAMDPFAGLFGMDHLSLAQSSSKQLRMSQAARNWFTRCIIPENEQQVLQIDRELTREQNEILHDMLNETMDMVESPLFAQVLQESLDSVFGVLMEDLSERKFKVAPSSSRQERSAANPAQNLESNPEGEETNVSTSSRRKEDGEYEDKASEKEGGNLDTEQAIVNEETEKEKPKEVETYLLTKVIVTLLKPVANQVLESNNEESTTRENKFVKALGNTSSLELLCTAIFQQGTEQAQSPLDGLGDLGFGDDDMKQIANLLGSLGGAGGDEDLMKLLGGDGGAGLMSLLGGLGEQGAQTTGPPGQSQGSNPFDLFASLAGGAPRGRNVNPSQGRGSPSQADEEFRRAIFEMRGSGTSNPNEEIERLFQRNNNP